METAALCPGCGRLMADETGPLCDHCDPPPVRLAQVETEARFHPFVTWILIAVTAVASDWALAATHEQFPLGTMFAPSVADGQWWQLISEMFVHYSFSHWFWNMLPLWFFGKRLERIVGHWAFLGFYVSCGAMANVPELFANPEGRCAGASGAGFAIAGALIVYYAVRFRELSRPQWIKLGVLTAFIGLAIWAGRHAVGEAVAVADHIGGLAAGMVLGLLLTARFGRRAMVRGWTFACTGILVVAAVVWFRQTHPYLVPLDRAAQALQTGTPDVAAHELHTALAMKPDSPLGAFLLDKLEHDRPDAMDCSSLPLSPYSAKFAEEPCTVLQCDGRLHTMAGPYWSTIGYRGSRQTSGTVFREGKLEKEITTRITMQAVDDFDRVRCTTTWSSVETQRVDRNGVAVGKPVRLNETTATVPDFMPEAVELHTAIQQNRQR